MNIEAPRRIGSFGHGKLAHRQPAAKLNLLPGRINLAWTTGGCPRIPVRRLTFVELRIYGGPRWHPRKLVAPVLAKFLLRLHRYTPGPPFPLAMLTNLSQAFRNIPRLGPFQRSQSQRSPPRVVRLMRDLDGKILQTLWGLQSQLRPAPTSVHGPGHLQSPQRAILRLLAHVGR